LLKFFKQKILHPGSGTKDENETSAVPPKFHASHFIARTALVESVHDRSVNCILDNGGMARFPYSAFAFQFTLRKDLLSLEIARLTPTRVRCDPAKNILVSINAFEILIFGIISLIVTKVKSLYHPTGICNFPLANCLKSYIIPHH